MIDRPPALLSRDQLLELVARYARDTPGSPGIPDAQTLQAKDGKRVCRIRLSDNTSAVLKLGYKPPFAAMLRRYTRTSSLDREVKMLTHLRKHGVYVPQLLGACRFHLPDVPYCYMILTEDLGDLGHATAALHRLLQTERFDEARRFEDALIDLTDAILRANVVDTDHSMINIVMTESGKPARLDLEVARRVWSPRLRPRLWGQMIGRLVATFTFAVQPDTARVEDFAARLVQRIEAPQSVLRHAKHAIDFFMDRQQRQCGIDTQIALPWG